MTRKMRKVWEQVESLPEGQQDRLADFLLHELAEDARWSQTTAEHEGKLQQFVNKVLADDAAGRCEPLNPDQL
jgi:hypothetical protein